MPENPEPTPDCNDEPKLTEEEWAYIEAMSGATPEAPASTGNSSGALPDAPQMAGHGPV